MKERMKFSELSPGLVKVMMDTETYLRKSNLPVEILELVRMRVSQI